MLTLCHWKPLLGLALAYFAVDAASAAEPTYWQDVRPILRKNCTACHNTRSLKEPDVSGGLALDSFDAAAKNPKLFTVGQSTDSPLVKLLTTPNADKRMPLGAMPLPEESIALIRKWIDTGASEGTRPDTVDTTVSTTVPTGTRKLDVVLPTSATPPAGLFGDAKPAALQLALKVGPLAPVTAVTFSPDGQQLVTGSYGLVTVWDLATVKPVRQITSVLGAVNDLRFSPDAALLAVAGGQPSAKGDLRLFSADGKLAATLAGHDDVVFGVAFSPDGHRLASASFDKTVRVWNVAGRKVELTLTGHSDFVYAVAFSPDGQKIASASKDRTVKLCDAMTGASLFTFSSGEQDVMALAFGAHGKTVISSGLEPAIAYWDAEKGGRVRNQAGHGVAVHELGLSKDGQTLISAGGDKTVRLWNPSTGAAVKRITVGSSVYAAALSPDGKRIASGSFDGLVRLWDVANGRHLLTLLSLPPQKEESSWLALTPEGYVSASSDLTALGQWRMNNQPVDGTSAWKALANSDVLTKAVRAEALSPPTFGK